MRILITDEGKNELNTSKIAISPIKKQKIYEKENILTIKSNDNETKQSKLIRILREKSKKDPYGKEKLFFSNNSDNVFIKELNKKLAEHKCEELIQSLQIKNTLTYADVNHIITLNNKRLSNWNRLCNKNKESKMILYKIMKTK